MAFECGFFNSLNKDRIYNTDDVSQLFTGLIHDGIFSTVGDQFAIKSAGGMNITIGTGKSWTFNAWTKNTALYPIVLTPGDVLNPRIDAIIHRVSRVENERTCVFVYKTGLPSSSPVAPELENSDIVEERYMALIDVAKAVTTITQSNIRSRIGTTDFPFVTAVNQSMSIDNIVAQWESEWDEWTLEEKDLFADMINTMDNQHEALLNKHTTDFNQLYSTSEEEFDAWFQTVKDKLGDDPATSLQGQILELEESQALVTSSQNGEYITAETVEFQTMGTKIEGHTFNNLLDFNADLLDIVSNNYYNRISKYGSSLNMSTSGFTEAYFIQNIDTIKPNTLYTLIINVISNASADKPFLLNKSSNLLNPQESVSLEIGANKFALLSTTDMTRANIFSVSIAERSPTANVQFNAVLLEGDYTDKYVPLGINGMESVRGELEVETRGANLLPNFRTEDVSKFGMTVTNNGDGTITISGTSTAYSGMPDTDVFTLPAGIYRLVSNGGNSNVYCRLYKNNVMKDAITSMFTTSSTFELFENTEVLLYTVFHTPTTFNGTIKPMIQRLKTKGDVTLPYQPYQGDTLSLGQQELHRLSDDIFDYIDLSKGELVKRVEKVVFDGSGDEQWSSNISLIPAEGIYGCYIKTTSDAGSTTTLSAKKVGELNIRSDYCETKRVTDESFVIFGEATRHAFYVILPSPNKTLQEFKDYLAAKPLTVLYELDEPVITKLSTKELKTYLSLTNMYVNGSTVSPKIVTNMATHVDPGFKGYVDTINMQLGNISGQEEDINSIKNSISSILEGLASKAPENHAHTTNKYGQATNLAFGHSKLSDSVTSTSDVEGGFSATPKAVKTAYDLAKTANDNANLKVAKTQITRSGTTLYINL